MSIESQLIEMGFTESKIKRAIQASGDNLEQAMEWMLAHQDEPDQAENETSTKPEEDRPNPEGQEASEEAKSLKCDDCGKIFRNSDEVQFHAAKSGHSNFSESTEEKKPLTEEEKAAKLKDIEEKLKQRRVEKEQEMQEEARQREKHRIQMSKQITETKQKFQEQEMKKLAEERRREKLEDKKARQKILDQIKADKEDRKYKAENSNSAPVKIAPVATSSQPSIKKTYDTTRLQLRLPSGSPLVQEFKSKESLSSVRLFVSLNRTDGVDSDAPFTLSTTFPRKVFSDEDLDKPLDALGLVPSAVLVVTNK